MLLADELPTCVPVNRDRAEEHHSSHSVGSTSFDDVLRPADVHALVFLTHRRRRIHEVQESRLKRIRTEFVQGWESMPVSFNR